MHAGQYASAFHYLSAAINLRYLMCRPYSHFARPDFAPTYMLLGITLAKLDDSQNAIAAFEKAVEINRCYLMPNVSLRGLAV